MEEKVLYLFDPLQLEAYGFSFYRGDKFTYRYEETKNFRKFFTYIYIPYGPICKDKEGFSNFIEHIKSFKMTKVKIDLPLILDKEIYQNVRSSLKKARFKESAYFYDEETIIVTPENYKLKNKYQNYIRTALKLFDLKVVDSFTDKQLYEIYELYLFASKRIGFPPEKKKVFTALGKSTLSILAYNKESKQLDGYIIGYIAKMYTKGFYKKDISKDLFIVYSALSDFGRNKRLGYLLRNELCLKGFSEFGIDIVDFHGASRTKNRSYIDFKQSFGGTFESMGGSFEKLFIF